MSYLLIDIDMGCGFQVLMKIEWGIIGPIV